MPWSNGSCPIAIGQLECSTSRARVIRPEALSLTNQLRAYVEAEVVIYPEGSAVQASRLLGRNLGRLIVIQRRPGRRIAEDALLPRSRSLDYVNALAGVVCGLNGADQPFQVLGLPIIDTERLVPMLQPELPVKSQHVV